MRSPVSNCINPQAHAVLLAIVMLQALSWLDGVNSQTLVLRDRYALTPAYDTLCGLLAPDASAMKPQYYRSVVPLPAVPDPLSSMQACTPPCKSCQLTSSTTSTWTGEDFPRCTLLPATRHPPPLPVVTATMVLFAASMCRPREQLLRPVQPRRLGVCHVHVVRHTSGV
jgi:hypothetical protein